MLSQNVVYVSIATSIFAGFFYLRDMWRGKAKPNLVSWVVWVLATTSAGLVILYKEGGLSSIPIFMAGFTPMCVVILALWKKNAQWKASGLDYVCLVLALLSLISFLVLQTGTLATICAILVDLLAFIPTYMKSARAPDTENLGPYLSGVFNPFLTLTTLSVFTFNTAGFAVYLFFGNLAEIGIVLMQRKKHKSINKTV